MYLFLSFVLIITHSVNIYFVFVICVQLQEVCSINSWDYFRCNRWSQTWI